MSSLVWKINRIKAMSFGEVIFRAGRFAYLKYEKFRILRGWKPIPRTVVGCGAPLYGQGIEDVMKEWRVFFGEFDPSAYEAALCKVNLFDEFEVDISGDMDWHRDPETGVIAPLIYGKEIDYRDNAQVGNCKTLWELSRHKHLVPLAVAYVITGDTKYVDRITEHVEGWIRQNPFGLGVHWCSSLEVSLRLIAWCHAHNLIMLRDRRGLFDRLDLHKEFSESIYQHAYFIVHYLSRYSSANNHLIGELTGLWVACNTFDMGVDGNAWAVLAKNGLENEAAKQVFEDGVSREQSTYYHHWVNEYLLLAWLIGQRYGTPFSRGFSERVSKMTEFLVDLRPSGGQMPQIGDSDDGRVLLFDPANKIDSYDDLISSVNAISRSSAKCDIEMTEKAFWYKNILGQTVLSESVLLAMDASREMVKVYPRGGYVILDDESFHAVFDAGNLGYPSIAAHGHADALSILMAWGCDWWIVDTGTYCYHTEPEWRDYFRGTGAHNTVYIDKTDQSQIGGPFLWLGRSKVFQSEVEKSDKNEIQFGGVAIGYSKNRAEHNRNLVYSSNCRKLTVKDSVKCIKACDFEIRFHFHPEIDLLCVGVNTIIAKHKKGELRVSIKLDARADWSIHSGDLEPLLGWYSDVLGRKMPCNVLVGKSSTESSRCIQTEFLW